MSWVKVLGIAGLAGVAAGRVVIAREQRRRGSYTPDEVRAKLRSRVGAPRFHGGPAQEWPELVG